jgi:hypothetical protein
MVRIVRRAGLRMIIAILALAVTAMPLHAVSMRTEHNQHSKPELATMKLVAHAAHRQHARTSDLKIGMPDSRATVLVSTSDHGMRTGMCCCLICYVALAADAAVPSIPISHDALPRAAVPEFSPQCAPDSVFKPPRLL